MRHHESEDVFLLKKSFGNKINLGVFLLVLGVIGGYLIHEFHHSCPVPINADTIEVCFTPGNPCESKIVRKIEEAKQEILLQAFSFTSEPITQALLRAKDRGVKITVLCDKGQFQKKYSRLQVLKKQKVPVYFDKQNSYAHNKVMIIDGKITITGSYNWTYSAQNRNSENVVFIASPEVSEKYKENFQALLPEIA